MLTADQGFVLAVLRGSLGAGQGGGLVYRDGNAVATYILRNGILPTVFKRLPAELQTGLRARHYASVGQSVEQGHVGSLVLEALGRAGLNCIGLKGWEMRGMYPDPTMRQMADFDVLVRPYDYARVAGALRRLGFSHGRESSWKHDSFQRRGVHVEAHKRLTDDSGPVRDWERSMWGRAEPLGGGVWRMSPEDYRVFHFVHMHKDFTNGSLGLRRVADTWLLGRVPADEEAVRKALASFGMLRFHDRMARLASAAMGEAEMDPGSETMLVHAFAHGIYGTDASYKAGRIAAMGPGLLSGKVRSAVSAVLLPYPRMRAQFPELEGRPALLPYFWAKRAAHFLRGDVRAYARRLDYGGVGEEEYEEMRRFFEAGGVL